MKEDIQLWLKSRGLPFKTLSALARALIVCKESPLFGKDANSITSYLSQVWRGERACSSDLEKALRCELEQVIGDSDMEAVIEDLRRHGQKSKRLVVPRFLSDPSNRCLIEAIAGFPKEIPPKESAIAKLIELVRQTPGLSTKTCTALLEDLQAQK